MKQYDKEIRDPIYGYIGLTEKQLAVINLPVFQRLRRISQLSFAELVYPNATHNRFSHSLGVMHLARILSDYLRSPHQAQRLELDLNDDDYEAIIWAGLLHDIGHLPFSHACEPIFAFYFNNDNFNKNKGKDYHVDIGARIIQDPRFGITRILEEKIVNKVCKLIKGDKTPETPDLLIEAMTGICSVDRLDYLKRDAYHAGTPEYAIIDSQRILTSLIPSPSGEVAPVFKKKALYALEGVVLSYFYMYKAIYFHHAVRAAYLLFQDIVWEAFEYGLKDKLNNLFDPDFWNHFDDHHFLTILRTLNKTVRNRLEKQIFRCLPKRVPYLRNTTMGAIHNCVDRMPFNEKVQLERKIKEMLRNKNYPVETLLLDSPMVIPYPRSLYGTPAIYIWEKGLREPANITQFATYLKELDGTAEQQLEPRVYVSPGDLIKNPEFIEALSRIINEISTKGGKG